MGEDDIYDYTNLLTIAPLSEEDIEQEFLLRKFLEKPVSKSILRRKASRERELLFPSEYWEEGVPIFPLQPQAIVHEETYHRLVLWASSESDTVFALIVDFLQSPSEENLHKTIGLLELEGVPLYPLGDDEQVKEIPFSKLLLSVLDTPRTKEELYEFGRRQLVTKRPEATVRQLLRRFLRSGFIIEDPKDVYSRAYS